MSINLDRSSWNRVTLGDVAVLSKEKVDPTEGSVDRYVAGEHMDTDDLKIYRWGDTREVDLGPAFHRRFRPGQVLYGSRRTYLRKVAVADFDGVCANTTFVVKTRNPQVFLQELLPFVMTAEPFHAFAIAESRGSVNPYVNWSDIARYEFDLPPLSEQKRIADLLWALERSREAASGLRDGASIARSVFLDTFTSNASKRSPVRLLARPGEQPVQVGPFGGTLASRHFTDSGVRVLKIQNVTSANRVDLDYSVFVSYEHAASLDRYRLREGDTVIVAQGATVGKTAMVDASIGDAVISQHLIRVRLDPERVLPQFAALMIQSDDFQRQIDTVRTKSTRDGLNTDDVGRFEIPNVNVRAQEQLVDQMVELDRAIESLEAERASLAVLRSALLADVVGGN